jgi:hypothetical protein
MRRKRKSRDAEKDGKFSWLVFSSGVFFLGLSLIGGYYAVSGLANLARARGWQENVCTVTSFDSERHTSAKSRTTYTPKISYAYRFDGRDLTGARFDLVDNHFDSEEIAAIKENYPPGARVACFVNPQNPSESVISRDFSQFPVFKYTVGLFFTFIFALALFYMALPQKT